MKRKPPTLDKPIKRHRHLTEDEAREWRAHMSGKPDSSPSRGEDKVRKDRVSTAFPPVPAPQERAKSGHAHRKTQKPEPATLDRGTVSRIRREQWKIEATLDLHGHTLATAHTALLRFVAGAQERGVRLALVITGKGRLNPGSLRAALPRWLLESPLRETVIGFDAAGPRHGGEGAWYVRIRKG